MCSANWEITGSPLLRGRKCGDPSASIGIYSYSSPSSQVLPSRSLAIMGITSIVGPSNVKFMWVPTHLGVSANLSMQGTYSVSGKITKHSLGLLCLRTKPTGLDKSPNNKPISSGLKEGYSFTSGFRVLLTWTTLLLKSIILMRPSWDINYSNTSTPQLKYLWHHPWWHMEVV